MLIIFILQHWSKTPQYLNPEKSKILNFSVVIPARNEASNIVACLDSLSTSFLGQPHEYEIIVIDDYSQDPTAKLVNDHPNNKIKLIKLSDDKKQKINAYKKVALAHGLKIAKGDYIIQMDADITIRKEYITTISAAIINSNADMIVGPVVFNDSPSAFINFQILDMLGMLAVTAAGINSRKWFMANGANLIYRNGLVAYKDEKLASGDDIYSVQKLASDGIKKIIFLNDPQAAVSTDAMSTFKDFYNQRIRWATKNKYMKGSWMRMMMLIPFLNAIIIPLHFIAVFIFGLPAIALALFHLIFKLLIDHIYLKELTGFYNKKTSLNHFIVSSFYHIVYIITIGVSSLFLKKYKWKGRSVT